MPTHARNHNEAREVVCVCCFKKSVKGRMVNERLGNMIRNLLPEFSTTNARFPKAICSTCRNKLEKGTLSNVFQYDDVSDDFTPSDEKCTCKICLVASSNQHSYFKELNIPKQKKGRPSTSSNEENNKHPVKVCPQCFTEVSPGKPHTCNKRHKIQNLILAAGNEKEQLASAILVEKRNETPDEPNLMKVVRIAQSQVMVKTMFFQYLSRYINQIK